MSQLAPAPLTRRDVVNAYQSGHRDFRGVQLAGLDLSSLALSGADFSGANCFNTILTHSQLTDTIFTGAQLDHALVDDCCWRRATLRDANLCGASLRNTLLCAADLTNATVAQADLTGCVLTHVTLAGVDLRSASLDTIRDDLWRYLALVPLETTDLLYLLWAGQFDGMRSEQGDACLAGTCEQLVRARVDAAPDTLLRASFVLTMRERLLELRSWREVTSARERWCSALRPGMTPDNSQIVAITAEWVERWLREHQPRWMNQADAEIRHGWRRDWKNAIYPQTWPR